MVHLLIFSLTMCHGLHFRRLGLVVTFCRDMYLTNIYCHKILFADSAEWFCLTLSFMHLTLRWCSKIYY